MAHWRHSGSEEACESRSNGFHRLRHHHGVRLASLVFLMLRADLFQLKSSVRCWSMLYFRFSGDFYLRGCWVRCCSIQKRKIQLFFNHDSSSELSLLKISQVTGAQESQRCSENLTNQNRVTVLIYQAHVAFLREMKSAEFSAFLQVKESVTTALLSTSSSHAFLEKIIRKSGKFDFRRAAVARCKYLNLDAARDLLRRRSYEREKEALGSSKFLPRHLISIAHEIWSCFTLAWVKRQIMSDEEDF